MLRLNTDSVQYSGAVLDLVMIGGVPYCLIGGAATIDGTQPPMRSEEQLGGVAADVDSTHVVAVLGHTQRFPMTVCGWFKAPAASDYFTIFSNTAAKTSNHMYRVGLSATKLALTFGSVAEYIFFGLPALTAGELYFFAVSVASNGGTATAYQASAKTDWSTDSLTVGTMSDPSGGMNAYLGTGNSYGPTIGVERVRQYNRVLTVTEIRHLYALETRNNLYAPA